MNRTLLIAANWKMNSPPEGAFSKGSPYVPYEGIDVLVFPTFLYLKQSLDAGICTGGQYGHPDSHGAHTGDISIAMLKEIGCTHVLCGHSERRQGHGETNEDVSRQAQAALDLGLHPVICIGETAKQREAGEAESTVHTQLSALPLHSDITIAYEPIWAIGTGNTATPELAQTMHAFIRSLLPDQSREKIRILYGGSMKPENAEELLLKEDIDGGLIGGASLKPDEFATIVSIASSL
ncbi:triose-phosphate isomerase [Candidatus Peregrinibacteria bacterium CG10_big_fil_rev_8_21_14_0_10_49_24]|nr:MAG: triose-phosphate isomerase [Candidatus Peregrinibacteria bacterium CG11_big_fil_rev_8_21_14_0_20_49_14]PIR50351.1 MAG: triose-phosphate isomerase [Candidatus Peregrinibacteria bacterium CG10_big_fil_rev_8_21_14_0_10_49_24]PJA67769.1 MAG: triose-phosphate isomerase [Candidatus Peregrinibacteria bacterium CG_4_9_14_3_um_filter_49_12]